MLGHLVQAQTFHRPGIEIVQDGMALLARGGQPGGVLLPQDRDGFFAGGDAVRNVKVVRVDQLRLRLQHLLRIAPLAHPLERAGLAAAATSTTASSSIICCRTFSSNIIISTTSTSSIIIITKYLNSYIWYNLFVFPLVILV